MVRQIELQINLYNPMAAFIKADHLSVCVDDVIKEMILQQLVGENTLQQHQSVAKYFQNNVRPLFRLKHENLSFIKLF